MERMRLLVLLFCAVLVSDGFNIDVTNPERFSGSEEGFFGYRVLQYQSDSDKQIIVSAPLRRSTNEKASGAIYSCTLNTANCTLLYQQDSSDAQFFGMSMALRSTPSASLTSCSPSLAHNCDGNSYLNGICYNFNSQLNLIANKTVAFQECTKSVVNLVFLFDGSSSMKTEDFKKNKNFIWKITTQLNNSFFKFAAVQFSAVPRTVFTFNDYMNGTAQKKLDEEEHMKDLTNTHQAIDYVLVNLFNNLSSGADPDARKALVIITDGTPTDFNTKDVIKRCEVKHITRFVIGVGNVDIKKLRIFSSAPKENNTFQIDDYSGLEGLLDKLQNKIYNIEGDQSGGHREWTKELSQSGFSAVYDKDVLVLGAVGSNKWRGMLYEVGATEVEIKDPKLNNDSYMGYSTAVGLRGKVSLLFSGAPRSNYNGQVTLFRKQNTWDITTRVKGEQVGSYFGASLCLLDLDSDGETDFLVVGAPLYYQAQPRREGRMYVYRLTNEMELEKVLEVSDCVQGQFAATVTSVADLNGDELQDIAVGAPLEDSGKGAVYIYLGNRTQGIRPNYSQRILARTISENLQQFGVAIDGVMDMEGDGLTDIAVGARGTVMLLKARPVLSVSAHLKFSPSEISLDNFDCLAQIDDPIEAVTLSACFSVEEKTQSTGAVSRGLNVSYEVRADPVRQWSRAFFIKKDKTSRSLLSSVLLDSPYSCFNHTVYMPSCVKDTVSPVLIRLNFSQAEQQPSSSNAILNIDSRTTANVEIPFQRNCGNVSCVADLQLDFNFLNKTLLVVDQSYFIITVSLLNKGDDSFNTSVELRYPEGLSLSKFDTIKASRRTLSSCGDRDDGALDKTTCSISLPVYRKGTSALFQATFRISGSYRWSDMMEMTLVASSSNNGNQTNGTVTKTLPVQFAVDVAIKLDSDHSVTYLNISLDDKGPKPVDIVYEVINNGVKSLPVSVKFMMPSKIGENFILRNHSITKPENPTDCSFRKKNDSANPMACNLTEETDPALCLNQKSCVKFECPSFCLEKESHVKFELKAQLTFLNPKQFTQRFHFSKFSLEDSFSSSAKLDFDKKLYHQIDNGPQDDGSKHHKAQASVKAELIIPPDMHMIVGSGAGGGLLLFIIFFVLLWKCGFFKRKRPGEEDGECAGREAQLEEKEKNPNDCNSQNEETSSKPDDKLLSSNGSENGGAPASEAVKGESGE
ncbi:integrin alpha-D [Pygocentrus nattereri]|uniref:VWFA domain-containing protein n=1 Tax=Pygocentrus nattereri TaxID=42514 RepID=A0A3B4BXH1_PYGNA|nr:integrin alpha-D [Pygocentrus nattereri]